MRNGQIFQVLAEWDSEARVWVASSDDVPGLVTEAGTCEELIEKLKIMIPELLALNGGYREDDLSDVPFKVVSERIEHTAHYHH